ncbi:MAG: Archaemetzincin [Promethearchaeota archaeon]|nr:MAG: Archaemetzincin [Candidatus Lokiarchaeota archaeon]
MNRYEKYKRKIKRYYHSISRYKLKLKRKVLKLRNIILEIGISKDEFNLMTPSAKAISYPCHLGILFIGDFQDNLFPIIRRHLLGIYGPFFYEIHDLGKKDSLQSFPGDSFKKGIKRELKEEQNAIRSLNLHPTKKFHQLLIEKQKQDNIDVILAITDLPLYSSYDKQIIFLFGEANLKHYCSVVSSFNLKEAFYERRQNPHLFEQRIIKESIHEVGHLLLGREHCQNEFCVMTYSTEIEGIDRKSPHLCKMCFDKLHSRRVKYNL